MRKMCEKMMSGGGSAGFCSYSMTTPNRLNFQISCENVCAYMKMALNTAISRFSSRILATCGQWASNEEVVNIGYFKVSIGGFELPRGSRSSATG